MLINKFKNYSEDNLQNYEDKSDNLCCIQCCSTNNKLLLFIPCKLGIDEICSDHQEIIKKFLSFESSIGMIGGKPKYAHYFLGYIGDQLIYLDPHWINECVKSDILIQHLSSYFSNEVHQMPINKLNTSVVFGFYFNNLVEINQFYLQLRSLEKEYGDNFFLVIEKQTPIYDYSTSSEIRKLQGNLFDSEIKQKLNELGFDCSQFENYDGNLSDEYDEDDEDKYQNQQNLYKDYERQEQCCDEANCQENCVNNCQQDQIQDQQNINFENQQRYQNKKSDDIKKYSIAKQQSDEDLQRLKTLYYQNSVPKTDLNENID